MIVQTLLALLLAGQSATAALADDPTIPALAGDSATGDGEALKALSSPMPIRGGPLLVVLLTDRSMDALWRGDAARDTLGIEVSNAGTSFYVSGVTTAPFHPSGIATLRQGGSVWTGRIVNVSNLNGSVVPPNGPVLGLIEFSAKVDPSKPFSVTLGDSEVEFHLEPDVARKWTTITRPPGQGF